MERSNVINKGIIGVLKQLLLEVVEQLNEGQEVFTKEEAAAFLNIKVSTLERLAFRKNEIGYTKPDRYAVFLKRDLLKFLENRRIPSVYDEGV
jgi:Helix-turn-helix domain